MRPIHACALVLSLVLAGFGAGAETVVGTADRVQNRVTAETGGEMRALQAAAPLLFTDLLRTETEARLEATLVDGTRIVMGEKAALRLDRFRYDSGRAGGSLTLRLIDGALLFIGGRVEDPPAGAITIRTGFARIGVRGTTLWAGPIDGAFGVLVIEGEVTVSNAGRAVRLGPGEGTTIPTRASPPRPPVVWPEAKVGRALAAVGFGT